jgi:hypothetical protein
MSEKQLQAKIVIAFSQAFPERRGRLFATFQETDKGSYLTSLGLVRGVSDLLYVTAYGELVGIELKEPGSKHKSDHVREQAEWLMKVPAKGYFCTSLEMFWKIIEGEEGIDPEWVLDDMGDKKTYVFK